MQRETEIGAAAVKAARSFGVRHLVWSTLRACERLTGGRLKVIALLMTEVGREVAAALAASDKLPNGSHLAVCGGIYSWNDFVATLNGQGHKLQVIRVPPEAYDNFYPGAREIRGMYQYYEQHTYFGPEGEKRIAAAHTLVPGGFTGFADWAKVHMKPG
jgi:hypothetical protein